MLEATSVWSSMRTRTLTLSVASRSTGSIEACNTDEASAETVLYARVVRSATVLCALASSARFLAVILVPRTAQVGEAYSILLFATMPRSALLLCDGPPRLGISLPMAFAESVALREACCICLVKESRVSISTPSYRIDRLIGITCPSTKSSGLLYLFFLVRTTFSIPIRIYNNSTNLIFLCI